MFDFICIGGGAAGIFSAIRVAEENPRWRVVVLESSTRILSKVKISGGGRCNVTHRSKPVHEFSENYPRGSKELLSPLSRFGSEEMREWLKSKGIATKTEADGRVFPITDSSQSIIDCFVDQMKSLGVELVSNYPVSKITVLSEGFHLESKKSSDQYDARRILLATGSSVSGHELAKKMGHKITALSPSLFSFNINHPLLEGLAGISFESVRCQLKTPTQNFTSEGPLLITHWGLSGPAILRLSAFAALALKACDYKSQLIVEIFPHLATEEIRARLRKKARQSPARLLKNENLFSLPQRFWEQFIQLNELESTRWAELSKKSEQALIDQLTKLSFQTDGKTTFKEEFVTAGGVARKEVDFRTMESRIQKNLFIAGELLDVDGVTGGFNFQNCWAGADTIARHLKTLTNR